MPSTKAKRGGSDIARLTPSSHLAKAFPSWADLDGNGNIVSISEEGYPFIKGQIMEVVNVINQQALQGPLQGLVSLTAIFKKLYVIDDNNQIADQLQLHELPPDDLYGLSTSTFKKQTAQKLICNNLRKSTLKRSLSQRYDLCSGDN